MYWRRRYVDNRNELLGARHAPSRQATYLVHLMPLLRLRPHFNGPMAGTYSFDDNLGVLNGIQCRRLPGQAQKKKDPFGSARPAHWQEQLAAPQIRMLANSEVMFFNIADG
jgi:hypothetical protein